jgi:hypothetical protein
VEVEQIFKVEKVLKGRAIKNYKPDKNLWLSRIMIDLARYEETQEKLVDIGEIMLYHRSDSKKKKATMMI